jgi:hypothetical protein
VLIRCTSQLDRRTPQRMPRWHIDDQAFYGPLGLDHLQGRNEVRVATNDYKLVRSVVVSIVQQLECDVDIGASASNAQKTGSHIGCPTRFCGGVVYE